MNRSLKLTVAFFVASLLAIAIVSPTFAQEATMTEAEKKEMIGNALANPLSFLWLLFLQNDTYRYDGDILEALGEDSQRQNITIVQPVLSMQITEKWKTIFRPVFPISSLKVPENVNISTSSSNPGQITGVDLDRETGLGDVVL
jgi:hypothetical protein